MWHQNKSTFLAILNTEAEKSSYVGKNEKEIGFPWTVDYPANLKTKLKIHLKEEKHLSD